MDEMIGLRIKERRKYLNISGAQIKELTGISTGNLSDIENGKSLPSAMAIIQLSKILKCSTDYILLGRPLNSELIDPSDIRVDQLIKNFHNMSALDQDELLMIAQIKVSKGKRQERSTPLEGNNITSGIA